MKPEELKRQFIELRAEGRSFAYIQEQLDVAKSTCASWEKELKDQIDVVKRASLQELVESYSMTKEARIKKLGTTLDKINEALDSADLSKLAPDKLLDFKLKYLEALKNEYIGLQPAFKIEEHAADSILSAYIDLLNRVRSGEVPKEQAEKENTILTGLLKAYETTELKEKVESLEAILSRRTAQKRNKKR